jgi:hypothetical protein
MSPTEAGGGWSFGNGGRKKGESEFWSFYQTKKREKKPTFGKSFKEKVPRQQRTDSLQVEAAALLGLAVGELVERDLSVALVHLDAGRALVGLELVLVLVLILSFFF